MLTKDFVKAFNLLSKDFGTPKMALARKLYLGGFPTWLGDWWPLIVSVMLLATAISFVLALDLIETESARWALSALVQAGAALVGIFFVALGILWGQSTHEQQRLKEALHSYMEKLSPVAPFDPEPTVLMDLQATLADAAESAPFQSGERKMQTLKECYWRLAVVSHATCLYYGVQRKPDESLTDAARLGFTVDGPMQSRLSQAAMLVSLDEKRFFRHLLDIDNGLSTIRRDLTPVGNCFNDFRRVMFQARRIDQVGVSLLKIEFFKKFSGKRLGAVSIMSLLFLIAGLVLLASLDKISDRLLPSLTLATISVGVLAVATVLSLVLSAFRSGRDL